MSPAARAERLDAPAMALLLLLCATWGVGQVAAKVGVGGISPLLQAGLRSGGAVLLIVAWARVGGVPLLARGGRPGYGAAVAVLFAGEILFLFSALASTHVSRVVLFVYTAPFVVTIGAHLLLPGERLRGGKLLGLGCAFAGVALGLGDGLRGSGPRALAGDAMALAAALFWGATTLTIKARGAAVAPLTTLFYELLGSALVLIPLSVLVGEPGVTRPTPLVLAALAFQIVVVAFASYLAWLRLLARYPASDLSAFTFWTPIFGVAAGGLLLGERISPALAAAVAFVALGTWLVHRSPRDARAHAETPPSSSSASSR